MSVKNPKNEDILEISRSFEKLLITHQEASERRQEKADAKMDVLVDSVNTLIRTDIAARKDMEHVVKRIENTELQLRELVAAQDSLARTVLLMSEREKGNKETKGRLVGLIVSVVGSVVTVAIVLWLGLDP